MALNLLVLNPRRDHLMYVRFYRLEAQQTYLKELAWHAKSHADCAEWPRALMDSALSDVARPQARIRTRGSVQRGFSAHAGCFRTQRSSFDDFVVLVFDGESSLPSQAYETFSVVFRRKPKVVHFFVAVCDIRFLDPDRGILSRLTFDAHHRKILRVNPDLPAIQKLVFRLGQ